MPNYWLFCGSPVLRSGRCPVASFFFLLLGQLSQVLAFGGLTHTVHLGAEPILSPIFAVELSMDMFLYNCSTGFFMWGFREIENLCCLHYCHPRIPLAQQHFDLVATHLEKFLFLSSHFSFYFYYEIIMDSQKVANKCTRRSHVPFMPLLPILTTCITIGQYWHLENDFDTIHKAYLDSTCMFYIHVCVYVCVYFHAIL